MKESDARKLFCPFVKDGAMVNDGRYCYGSGCMMWEVHSEWVPFDQKTKKGGEWIGKDHPDYTPHGDCGLKSKGLD